MQHYIGFELRMICQLDMLWYDVDPFFFKKKCAACINKIIDLHNNHTQARL